MNFFKKGAVLREPIASRKSITESPTGNHEMKITSLNTNENWIRKSKNNNIP